MKQLVVVESPAKAKTIEKYLGKDFKVLASYGHVRDLPEKGLGVDVKHNYQPEYVTIGRKDAVSALERSAKTASTVYLATDLDREGEAIAWHVKELLKLPTSKTKRVVFNQITKHAIEEAFKHPRDLDQNLVEAQTARRILDRLVGYTLSPLLWKKIRRGLSAGRVQSVAVRLVVDREDEIRKFKTVEYWAIRADLEKPKSEPRFLAKLYAKAGQRFDQLAVKDEKAAKAIEAAVKTGDWQVSTVTDKPGKRTPAAPFTTASLQMEAARRLGYAARRTMTIAQHLYEAGHITYMRTDSVNLAEEAIQSARSLILEDYGKQYVAATPRRYQTKTQRAQEAHEAVRPTDLSLRAEAIPGLDAGEAKLYDLIWKRTVASQMADAALKLKEVLIDVYPNQSSTSVRALPARGEHSGGGTERSEDIGGTPSKAGVPPSPYTFQAKGEVIAFPGFLTLYIEGIDDEEPEEGGELPDLKVGDKLNLHELLVEQKFTQPPARYTEATLIKALEAHGIGRPSTYAPILSTIQDRGYTKLIEKRFHPEEVGEIVTNLLKEHFAGIVNLEFTATMEGELDNIADGKRDWVPVVDEFYKPFAAEVKAKTAEIKKSDFQEETDEDCPKCGQAKLVSKLGRYGRFLACSRFPDCDYSRPLDQKVDENGEPESVGTCPDCQKPLIQKRGRFGSFIGCSGYPDCKYTQKEEKDKPKVIDGLLCPKDNGPVVERKTRRGKVFWGCQNFPKCDFATWDDPRAMTPEQLKAAADKPADKPKRTTRRRPTKKK